MHVRFDDRSQQIGYTGHFLAPAYENGSLSLEVRHESRPYFVLPRVRFDAASRPIMRVRMSVEHAKKLAVQFATEEKPSRKDHPQMDFDLIAYGAMHDYAIDLAKVAGEGKWSGTVYRVIFGFPEGTQRGEKIRVESVSFEARP